MLKSIPPASPRQKRGERSGIPKFYILIFKFLTKKMSDNDNEQSKEKFEIDEFVAQIKPKPRWRRFAFGFWILVLVALVVGIGGLLVYKTGFTFSQMQTEKLEKLPLIDDLTTMNTPQPETDRLNILALGLRGEEDPNGGLLTDSIMVITLKKSTGQVALISIPRDLYITMPGQKYKEKINFAYALGFEQKGAAGGMFLSKIAVSRVTGLFIDHVVTINHAAFKEVVDALGGVDVTLDKPFQEKTQFAKDILIDLPVGQNHLDGNTALYFVRSRFSTSDFDRAQRQQAVLLAVKEKALSLGVLSNPVTIFQTMGSLGKNVRTDLSFSEIKNLIGLASDINIKEVRHRVFDTTPEGLLYSTKSDIGAYILLPVEEDFSKIQEACKIIFN